MKPLRMTPGSRPGLAVGGAALGCAALGLGAALYALFVERTLVQLDRYTVPAPGSGLPPGGITILHLSDFHFRAGGRIQARKIAQARRLIAGLRYDLVALTGDLIHDAAGLPRALELIGSLTPSLGAFACPGNHDYCEYSVWGVFGRTWISSAACASWATSPARCCATSWSGCRSPSTMWPP